MPRTSLFIVVVLVAAAAVAGLVALTRTSAAAESTTPEAGSQPRIAYELERLDALEKDIRAKIAAASRPVPAPGPAGSSRPVLVTQPTATVERHTDDEADEREGTSETGERGAEDEHDDERDD